MKWAREQKGMSGGDNMNDETPVLEGLWDAARNSSLTVAEVLSEIGVHKSIVNRLLEPFMWHTAIITSTEWDNFFHQRCSPLAQPEMQAVADEMQRAYYLSVPRTLNYGEWHLPYISYNDDWDMIVDYVGHDRPGIEFTECAKRVSTARCARVSYLTHDGKREIARDVELYEKLLTDGHWSPFEHVASPVNPKFCDPGVTGNFVGWKPYRKQFTPREHVRDFKPNLPDLVMKLDRRDRDAG